MNTRFYNAKILLTNDAPADAAARFTITEGELWVEGTVITYIGDGITIRKPDPVLEDSHRIYSRRRGPAADGRTQPVWDREIDCEGNLLMPGFKNAHSHTTMTFLRSYADDVPLQEWLYDQVFPKEDQLTPEIVYDLAVLGNMEYLTSGITANFDMYYFPLTNAQASIDCGFRTIQMGGINDFGGKLSLIDEFCDEIPKMSDLVSYYVGLHGEYTTSMKLMEGVAALAEKHKSPVFMHNAETHDEVIGCYKRWGLSPTEVTDRLGMYRYGGGGFHCVWFGENDFEIFHEKGLTAVTCPASNLKLASGIAPLKRFADEGIRLAIGTDGAASNNALDMFREMYLASALAKVRENDAAGIAAEEILYAATAGGAQAMQLPDCDRLAPGKKADLILIDLMQPNMQPENNIVKNIVYSGSKQNVKLTMINGRILYENNQFHIGFDPKDIYRRANEAIRSMK